VESLKDPLRSKTGDSINIFPRMLRTKFLIKRMSFSYLRSLYTTILWKMSSLISKFYGSLASTGFYAAITFYHTLKLALLVNYFNSVLNGEVKFESDTMSLNDFSLTNEGQVYAV
jgi:hypothetical protein